MHSKLIQEKLPELEKERDLVSISPMPSPDYDAPSPEADEMELELPDEEDSNTHRVTAASRSRTADNDEGDSDEAFEPPTPDLNSRLDSIMNDRSAAAAMMGHESGVQVSEYIYIKERKLRIQGGASKFELLNPINTGNDD